MKHKIKPFYSQGTGAVSYTHLRAHETSLHLVCRLLLEKMITCLLYTSDAADDMQCVDLGGRRIIKKTATMPTT